MAYRTTSGYLLAGAIAMVATASFASAATLFSDTFSRTTGSSDVNGNPAGAGNGFSSWGANDNLLGGTQSATYIVGPSRTGGANQSTNGSKAVTYNGAAFLNIDAAALAPNGFSVAFDFMRFANSTPTTDSPGAVALGLGASAGTTAANLASGAFATSTNTDFAVLFQQAAAPNAGNTQFFQDGAFLPGTTATGPLDYGDPLVQHSVLLTMTPVTPGAYGDADTINGSIRVDGGAAYNFTVLGGADFGTIAFSSTQNAFRGYDNLVVSSLGGGVIPEPATLAAVAGAGLALVRRRRRA